MIYAKYRVNTTKKGGLMPEPVRTLEVARKAKLTKSQKLKAWYKRWASNIAGSFHIFFHVLWTYGPQMLLAVGCILTIAACFFCGYLLAVYYPPADIWLRSFKGIVYGVCLLSLLLGGKAMKNIYEWPIKKQMMQAAANARAAAQLATD